jgi:hypothetical protein
MLRTRVTSVLWRSLNGRLERAALSGKVSGEDPGGVAGGTRGREGQEENRAATGGEQDKEPSVPVPLSRGNIGEGAAAAAQSSGNSGAGEEAASRSTRGGDAPPSPASAGTTAASGGAKPGGLGQEGNIASSGQMFEDRYAATGRAVLVKDRGPGRAAQAECLTRCAGAQARLRQKMMPQIEMTIQAVNDKTGWTEARPAPARPPTTRSRAALTRGARGAPLCAGGAAQERDRKPGGGAEPGAAPVPADARAAGGG